MEQDNSQKTALMLALESRMYRHAELLVNLEQGQLAIVQIKQLYELY